MTRLSANLGFLWPDRPLLARIDAAARLGFGAIELHWPYDTPAEEVAERCRRHGLRVLGLNTARGELARGENGLGAVEGRGAAFAQSVDQAIAYAVAVGAGAVHCMAGVAPSSGRAILVENLRSASAKAETHGLTLLLEPLNRHDAPGYFYNRIDEAADVIAEVGRPNVRLMFDAYHVAREGQPVLEVLGRSFELIGHVQIAAVPSRAEPGTGELDYRGLLRALDRLGYAGWVGAEYKPAGDTDLGMGWIEALGLSLCC